MPLSQNWNNYIAGETCKVEKYSKFYNWPLSQLHRLEINELILLNFCFHDSHPCLYKLESAITYIISGYLKSNLITYKLTSTIDQIEIEKRFHISTEEIQIAKNVFLMQKKLLKFLSILHILHILKRPQIYLSSTISFKFSIYITPGWI